MHHFRHFCEGGSFQLWADHIPLVTALTHVSVPISPRQQCHLAFISEFNVEMLYLYLPGLKTLLLFFCLVPPLPHRGPLKQSLPRQRPIQSTLKQWLPSKPLRRNTVLARWLIPPTGFLPSRCPTPRWRCFNRHFLPHCSPKFRKDIFFYFFPQISHPGRLASRHMVSSRFVWRGLASDITTWWRACLHCQQAKIHHHTRLQPQPVAILQRRFSHLHIDLVGPLQYSGGFNLFSLSMITHPIGWMQFPYLIRPWRHALKL
jgi:hypothetical protein